MNHLMIAPIVWPLVAGAALLLLERLGSRWVPLVALASTLLLGAIAATLLVQSARGEVQAYLLGNWSAPWGIALALDRTSALLVALTAAVGVGALLHALGGDAQRGPHFHALFQFQLMGLNGAFLTADLFNLFVFFEVLLAASYGLLLHGDASGRRARLTSALHYVVFNLAGSALFLVAVSLLYGIAGTLNMADLAVKLATLPPEDHRLAQAAASMLLVVFAVKAALLPLYFWLPEAYASATAPAAALFAVLTKVGVYSIARVWTLVFGAGAGALLPAEPLLLLALATLALAAVGALAARRLSGLVAYLVVASAGTLMLAVGLATPASLGAGLFYLVHSTLIAAAWFLLIERIGSARGASDRLVAAAFGPARAWTPLGAAFVIAAAAAAGMPPLAGFIGKALLLQAAGQTPWGAWATVIVLGSSLAVMVALARAGSVLFWEPAPAANAPAANAPAAAPGAAAKSGAVALLLAGAIGCAVAAGPLAAFTAAAGAQLLDRRPYIAAVLGAQPVPPAYDVRREMRERGQAR